jgi:hypothetical protein
MAARSKIKVHFFEEGFMVRGTDDPVEAYGLALEASDGSESGDNVGGRAYTSLQIPEGDEQTPTAEEINQLADDVWTLVKGARTGRCRIVPSAPGDRNYCKWWVWPLDDRAHGPGVFTAVTFW